MLDSKSGDIGIQYLSSSSSTLHTTGQSVDLSHGVESSQSFKACKLVLTNKMAGPAQYDHECCMASPVGLGNKISFEKMKHDGKSCKI